MIIREMQKDIDIEQLSNFDASFSTEFVYRVAVKGLSVEIVEEKLDAPFQKTYQPFIENDINDSDYAIVAEIDGMIVGFAAVKNEKWSKRAILTAIFVAPENKGKGIGVALVDAVINYVKTIPARVLWVETQNVNHPAIQFYTKIGFEFCGFDNTLYNPDDTPSNEVAFYFCKKF